MDFEGIVRVCKRQAMLATICLDPMGVLGGAIEEIPVEFVNRKSGYCGYHTNFGNGDLGRIVLNKKNCPDEKELETTLYHELGHAICHWLYGTEAGIHDGKWFAVMERLGQFDEIKLYQARK